MCHTWIPLSALWDSNHLSSCWRWLQPLDVAHGRVGMGSTNPPGHWLSVRPILSDSAVMATTSAHNFKEHLSTSPTNYAMVVSKPWSRSGSEQWVSVLSSASRVLPMTTPQHGRFPILQVCGFFIFSYQMLPYKIVAFFWMLFPCYSSFDLFKY